MVTHGVGSIVRRFNEGEAHDHLETLPELYARPLLYVEYWEFPSDLLVVGALVRTDGVKSESRPRISQIILSG